MIERTQTIPWGKFSEKHKVYIKNALKNALNVAEGAIRSGKTIDHCIIAAAYLETCKDNNLFACLCFYKQCFVVFELSPFTPTTE